MRPRRPRGISVVCGDPRAGGGAAGRGLRPAGARHRPRPRRSRCRRSAPSTPPPPVPLSADQVSTATVEALQAVLAGAVPGGVRPPLDRHRRFRAGAHHQPQRVARRPACDAPPTWPTRPSTARRPTSWPGTPIGCCRSRCRSSARPGPWSCWPTRSATPCTTGSVWTRNGRATRPGTRRSCSRRWPTATPGWRWRTWCSGRSPGCRSGSQDRDQALLALVGFRDPLGVDAGDAGAHGNAFDRVSAFQSGYADGPARCAGMTMDNQTFTQRRFGSAEDLARRGNLPLDALLGAFEHGRPPVVQQPGRRPGARLAGAGPGRRARPARAGPPRRRGPRCSARPTAPWR